MIKITTLFLKIVQFFIKLLKLGEGHAIPGFILLKLHPNLVYTLQSYLPRNLVLITGTNGKTTTTALIAHLLKESGLHVLTTNGENILTSLIGLIFLKQPLFGRAAYDIAVFEVDEFTLTAFMKYVDPTALVFLNISRDQLDRHWELDIVLEKWEECIRVLSSNSFIVLNSQQPEISELASYFGGPVYYFNDDPELLTKTNLVGAFNAKNINCAVQVTTQITGKDLTSHLSTFRYAYGRGESIELGEKKLQVFLAKNPASLNENLSLLTSGAISYDSLIFILNDHVPDGHDVSWIYDIDPILLDSACSGKNIFVSGTRAHDMAIRLGYAEIRIDQHNITPDLNSALRKLTKCERCAEIIMLPNYSAMLEARKILTGKRI